MKAIEYIDKTREYLDYLQDHIINVSRAWIELTDKCKDMRFISDDYVYNSLCDEITDHDLSKLSAEEFVQYREAFFPVDGKDKKPLGDAWEHHRANNPHHWENWTAEKYINPYAWEVHCVHMVCDWMAMGYKFEDTAQEYYERNTDRIKLPGYAVAFIYEIFDRIKPKGVEK